MKHDYLNNCSISYYDSIQYRIMCFYKNIFIYNVSCSIGFILFTTAPPLRGTQTEEQQTAISLHKNPPWLINAYGTIECSQ